MARFDLALKATISIESPHTQAQIESRLSRANWLPLLQAFAAALVALDPTGQTSTIAGTGTAKLTHVNPAAVAGEDDPAAAPFTLTVDVEEQRDDAVT